ncbi:hypothetical protein EMIT0196MI5_60248 [Pseudomonas sp. IT-196MI5]
MKWSHVQIAAKQFGVAAVRGFADRSQRQLGIPEGIPRTVAMTQNDRHKKVLLLGEAIMP